MKKTLLFLILFITSVSHLYSQNISGTGTQADPYILYDARDIDSIRYLGYTKYYKMNNDIDFTGFTDAVGNAFFTPIGTTTAVYFSGGFDGNGHILSNMDIRNNGSTYTGLFGVYRPTVTAPSTQSYIKNVTMKSCSLTTTTTPINQSVGMLVGYLYLGSNVTTSTHQIYDIKILDCYLGASCNITSTAQNFYVGGLIGSIGNNYTTYIYNILIDGNTIIGTQGGTSGYGNAFIGGCVGYINRTSIWESIAIRNNFIQSNTTIAMTSYDTYTQANGFGYLGSSGIIARMVFINNNEITCRIMRNSIRRGANGYSYSPGSSGVSTACYTAQNNIYGSGTYPNLVSSFYAFCASNNDEWNYTANLGDTVSNKLIGGTTQSNFRYGDNYKFDNPCPINRDSLKSYDYSIYKTAGWNTYFGDKFFIDSRFNNGYPELKFMFPQYPLTPTVTGVTGNQLTITGTFDGSVDTVRVLLGTTETNVIDSSNSSSHTFTGLSPSTTYYLRTAIVHNGQYYRSTYIKVKTESNNSHISGTGSEADPWLLYNARDIDSIRTYDYNTTSKKWFALANDIDFTGFSSIYGDTLFRPLTLLNATSFGNNNFEGNNHVIKNFIINANFSISDMPRRDSYGFFGYIYNNTSTRLYIRNFQIDKSLVFVGRDMYGYWHPTSDRYNGYGILIGRMIDNSSSVYTIKNIKITNSKIILDSLYYGDRTYVPSVAAVIGMPYSTSNIVNGDSLYRILVDRCTIINNYTRNDALYAGTSAILGESVTLGRYGAKLQIGVSNCWISQRTAGGTGTQNDAPAPFCGYEWSDNWKDCYSLNNTIISSGAYTNNISSTHPGGFLTEMAFTNPITNIYVSGNKLVSYGTDTVHCGNFISYFNPPGAYTMNLDTTIYVDTLLNTGYNKWVGYKGADDVIGTPPKTSVYSTMQNNPSFYSSFDFNNVWSYDPSKNDGFPYLTMFDEYYQTPELPVINGFHKRKWWHFKVY